MGLRRWYASDGAQSGTTIGTCTGLNRARTVPAGQVWCDFGLAEPQCLATSRRLDDGRLWLGTRWLKDSEASERLGRWYK